VVLLSVGLPGRFADWCDAVMVRLAGSSGGEVVCRTWPTLASMFSYQEIPSILDELGRMLIGSDVTHIVIGARQPDHELLANLMRSNLRILVVLDDPRVAVADMLAETGAEPRMVVRAVANSCPLVMQYTALAGALTLNGGQAAANPVDAVLAIARHFGIAIDGELAAAIAADVAIPMQADSSGTSKMALSHLPPGSRKIVDGAVLPYQGWFTDGRLDQITWTRDLFHLASDPSRAPTEPLDVSGGTRILIYGPYMQLPAGTWTAQVVLGFSPGAAAHTFLVDAFADGQLAATTFQPGRPGIYTAELTFSLGTNVGKGVEVRVTVMDGHAQGQLAFGHVVLNPIAMRAPDGPFSSPNDFAAVLEL
jgi:hypothetical protein